MVVETTEKKILNKLNTGVSVTDLFTNIVQNGTLVIQGGSATDELKTIYTVPSGKVLYITAMHLSYIQEGTTAGTVFIQLANSYIPTALDSNASNGDHEAVTLSFPIPIKLSAGDDVNLYSSSSTVKAEGFIIGYIMNA